MTETLQSDFRMFIVPVDILDVKGLSIYEQMTYIVIQSHTSARNRTAFPSYETIAKEGRMSRRHAIRCVDSLIQRGLLLKETQMRVTKQREIVQTSNLYHVKDPQKVVTHSHQGSDSQSPGVVTHSHQGSDSQSPEHNHLTKQYEQYHMNNNIEPVVAVQNDELDVVKTKIESELGKSIKSLLPQLKKWLEEYGADSLIEKAQFMGASKSKWQNIVGSFRTAVVENWDTSLVSGGFAEVAATSEHGQIKDERYSAFYQLFPDA